jgi:hypothetical protein
VIFDWVSHDVTSRDQREENARDQLEDELREGMAFGSLTLDPSIGFLLSRSRVVTILDRLRAFLSGSGFGKRHLQLLDLDHGESVSIVLVGERQTPILSYPHL